MSTTVRGLSIALSLALIGVDVFSFVPEGSKLACKKSALAAWKPLPKLRYSCAGAKDEWDEKILKLPARLTALRLLSRQLESFNSAAWWQASTTDLNVCDFQGKAGTLTAEEKENFDSSYVLQLFGDNHIRLVLLPDPCYQTGYAGSVAFLLNRKGAKTFASQALDGYSSRADNSVNVDFAKLNQEEIIEVSTGTGGLHPELTNYYFTIDPKTNRAVPKKLFESEKGLTNEIASALLMNDPVDFELPAEAVALKVIDAHKFAKSFSIYAEDTDGKIDDNGRTLTRKVLKWNGKIYK
jgi:hypothetical protein